MEILLEPKRDFMRDGTAREAHGLLATNPLIHKTFAVAIAEMHRRGMSPTAMAGVNDFIYCWMNLGEEYVPPKQIPNKHLQSFGQPTTTKTTEA